MNSMFDRSSDPRKALALVENISRQQNKVENKTGIGESNRVDEVVR